MMSILSFSGLNWLRGAGFWIVFAIAIDGLAQAGADDAAAPLKSHNPASAHNLLVATAGNLAIGARQVAKVEMTSFDPATLSQSAFGDSEQTLQR
jgi:hypothetical protein